MSKKREEEFEEFWKLLLGRKVDKKKAKAEYLKIDTNLSPRELASRFNYLYKNVSKYSVTHDFLNDFEEEETSLEDDTNPF